MSAFLGDASSAATTLQPRTGCAWGHRSRFWGLVLLGDAYRVARSVAWRVLGGVLYLGIVVPFWRAGLRWRSSHRITEAPVV
jgi:hypothetical protein